MMWILMSGELLLVSWDMATSRNENKRDESGPRVLCSRRDERAESERCRRLAVVKA